MSAMAALIGWRPASLWQTCLSLVIMPLTLICRVLGNSQSSQGGQLLQQRPRYKITEPGFTLFCRLCHICSSDAFQMSHQGDVHGSIAMSFLPPLWVTHCLRFLALITFSGGENGHFCPAISNHQSWFFDFSAGFWGQLTNDPEKPPHSLFRQKRILYMEPLLLTLSACGSGESLLMKK